VLNQRLGSPPRALPASDQSVARIAEESRIWTALGVSIALLAVGLLIATFSLLALSDQAIDATSSEIQYATAMSAAALNAKAVANDERGYLLSGNEEFLVQIDSRIPLAREAFAQAMDVADAAQRARLAEIRDLFEQWFTLVEEEIGMYQAGEVQAAREASVGRTRDIRHDYESMLAEASLIQSGVPRAQATISSWSGWSLAILLGYLVVSTIVVLVVGSWAVAGLRSTRESSDGRLAPQSQARSGDPEVRRP
jgi:methyl-accepting chemotaxis protein